MLSGQGNPRTGGNRFAYKSVGHEMVVPRTDAVVLASRPEQGKSARPAQGHYSGNASAFPTLPADRSRRSPFREV